LVLLTAKAAGPGMKTCDDDCSEAMVGGIYPRFVNYVYCMQHERQFIDSYANYDTSSDG